MKDSTSKQQINPTVQQIGIKKMALIVVLSFGYTIYMAAQHVEIQGKAKVTVMDTANTENLIVVKQADGTLATRQVSSLPPAQPDTTRTLATDLELAKLLCDCSNAMPPYLVQSALDGGYTAQDLFAAGVPFANLFAGGLFIADLLDGGITPIDIYNGGVPLDSLWGKLYQGGLIFYLDTTDGTGLVSALSDQSAGVQWYNGGNLTTNATGAAIGTGQANTDSIISNQGAGNYAAYICDTLTLNAFTDWFFPSKDELDLMW